MLVVAMKRYKEQHILIVVLILGKAGKTLLTFIILIACSSVLFILQQLSYVYIYAAVATVATSFTDKTGGVREYCPFHNIHNNILLLIYLSGTWY